MKKKIALVLVLTLILSMTVTAGVQAIDNKPKLLELGMYLSLGLPYEGIPGFSGPIDVSVSCSHCRTRITGQVRRMTTSSGNVSYVACADFRCGNTSCGYREYKAGETISGFFTR